MSSSEVIKLFDQNQQLRMNICQGGARGKFIINSTAWCKHSNIADYIGRGGRKGQGRDKVQMLLLLLTSNMQNWSDWDSRPCISTFELWTSVEKAQSVDLITVIGGSFLIDVPPHSDSLVCPLHMYIVRYFKWSTPETVAAQARLRWWWRWSGCWVK